MSRKTVERNIAYDDARGKFYVNLDYGVDPETGRQIKKMKTCSKLQEARAILRQHEVERDKGMTVLPKSMTVSQWLAEWMDTVVCPNRAPTTVYAYENIIKQHIEPVLGEIPLQKLTAKDIQRYYADKLGKGNLSPNTVHKHHDLLHNACKVAVRLDLLVVNPVDKVVPPQVKKSEIHYYSVEELQQLFQAVDGTRMDIVIKLAGYLGLRREEILGLKWLDVDLEHQALNIRQARTAAGSRIIEKETKTESSARVLHMPDPLAEVLHRELDRQNQYRSELGTAYQDDGYVVAWEDGRPYRPNYISYLFGKVIKDNQLPQITLHGLRHTFASVANSLGVPMYDIGKALGHSSPATTSKIYTHLLDKQNRMTMDRVADALDSKSESNCFQTSRDQYDCGSPVAR